MAYSKGFRAGMDDAVAKVRWRIHSHLQTHLKPHPEDSGATRADLMKSLVVLCDCLENFVSEVVGCLENELDRLKAAGAGARPKPKAAAGRGSSRRLPAARRRRR